MVVAVRQPFRAGSFYPADRAECEAEIKRCLSAGDAADNRKAPRNIVGAIVPHAGWAYSGTVAGRLFTVLSKRAPVESVVVFGAVHVPGVYRPTLVSTGSWSTPLGAVEIDEPLARAILRRGDGLIIDDAWAHRVEHSIEVLIPFIQTVYPGARFVPIMVPPLMEASRVGSLVAEILTAKPGRSLVLGSTDLTHYGEERYGFAPAGSGPEALEWVKEDNDRRIIDLMLSLRSEKVLEEVRIHHNACGAGAIVATQQAVKNLGCRKGHLLCHTTSYDEKPEGPPRDFVGYATIAYG